jgi:hypothetical protein
VKGVENAGEAVLVAVHRIPEPLVADVARACAQAQALYLSWSGDDHLPAMSQAASLLIAGLAPGEREIPEDIVRLMTRAIPGLPVLLLCDEPLTRPSVSLQSGRVTLLGPPFSRSRIYGRLRVLLADRGTPTESVVAGAARPIVTCERQRTHWWVAAFDAWGPGAGIAPGTPVQIHQSTAKGLTAVLPGSGGAHLPNVERVVDAVRKAEPDADKESALSELLGLGVGVVHLSPAAREWLFYWPAEAWPLLIYSPTRLPPRFDLRGTIDRLESRILRLAAAPGDLLVSTTRSPPGAMTDTMWEAMADGGPVLLDLFVQTLRGKPASLAGVLVEVR